VRLLPICKERQFFSYTTEIKGFKPISEVGSVALPLEKNGLEESSITWTHQQFRRVTSD